MKKLILTNSILIALLLSACGNDDSSNEEETTFEENETEETSPSAEDESAEMEQRIEDLESEIEVLENENEELTAELDELSEEESNETSDDDQSADSTEDEGFSNDDIEVIKESSTEFENQYDSVNVELTDARVSSMTIPEEDLWLFEKVDSPGSYDYIVLDFEVSNTVDEPRDFFLSFTQMVTNTNQQVESDAGASQGLQSDMLGEVNSSGQVLFFIEEGTGEDIEWIDLEIPAVFEGGTIDRLSDEDQVRIEFE